MEPKENALRVVAGLGAGRWEYDIGLDAGLGGERARAIRGAVSDLLGQPARIEVFIDGSWLLSCHDPEWRDR